MNVLLNLKDIEKGRTEEVLAIIFLLLRKFANTKQLSGNEFAQSFTEAIINECFTIIDKNQARNLKDDEEEQEEKIMLTVSCIYFLKHCS